VYDLAIVDPQYGRREHGGKNRSGNVTQKNGSRLYVKDGGYEKKDWDKEPPTAEYFELLKRVSKHQIIWGENYFPYFFGSGRIVWDKVNDGSDQSACEIAYNSLTKRVDLFRFMWRGMLQGKSVIEGHIQQGNKRLNQKRIHPTEKPIPLYKWLLTKYAKQGWKILDTHGGSMGIAIACEELGFSLDLWEIEPGYYRDGVARYNQYKQQHRQQLNLPA
jgi:site-specific DNA-methyltransferase (adenine-specific)